MSKKPSCLILSMSLGEHRDYLKYTYSYLRRYATDIQANLLILNDNSSIIKEHPFSSIRTGRGNISYVLKAYVIYHFLEKYDKILWLDDTCIIKKETDNLFDLVQDGFIGAYNEGENKALNSWKNDKSFILEKKKFIIDEQQYVNSGVVVYTKKLRPLFSNEMIIRHKDLFQSKYPHQAFLNYILQSNKIPIVTFDKKYNIMLVNCNYNEAGRNLNAEQICDSDITKESSGIYHITGFYKNRTEIIIAIHTILKKHNM